MHTHIHIHVHAHLYTERKSQQQHLDVSNNIIHAHTHPNTYACIYTCICIHTYVHNLQRICCRCVRCCQSKICITHGLMLLLLLRKKYSSSFAGSCMCSNLFLRFVNIGFFWQFFFCFFTGAHALVPGTPVLKCTQHPLQQMHIYVYIHTYAYAYICTRIHMRIYDTVQTRWRMATEIQNLCTNINTHTYTQVYTCMCIPIHIHI